MVDAKSVDSEWLRFPLLEDDGCFSTMIDDRMGRPPGEEKTLLI